jgi:hypothetical protein
MFWRQNEAKVTISEANFTILKRKLVFWWDNEGNETNSEAKEIDSGVCLINGRERAFYLWNSEDSLINNNVFSTKRTVRA